MTETATETPTPPTEIERSEFAGNYPVLTMKNEDLMLAIRENLGAAGLTPQEMDRVRVPSGGGRTWSVPSLTGDEEVQDLTGIIVAYRDVKTFWAESFEQTGGNTPPDCFSNDLVLGIGDPGGPCKGCPNNQFGSAREGQGAGKACRDLRLLFLLREKSFLPLVVTVPPGSLKPVKQYFVRLAGEALPYYTVVTSLKLEAAKSGGGITFSQIQPALAGRLNADEVTRVRGYSEQFSAVLENMLVEREDAGDA